MYCVMRHIMKLSCVMQLSAIISNVMLHNAMLYNVTLQRGTIHSVILHCLLPQSMMLWYVMIHGVTDEQAIVLKNAELKERLGY